MPIALKDENGISGGEVTLLDAEGKPATVEFDDGRADGHPHQLLRCAGVYRRGAPDPTFHDLYLPAK
ncbi:MAG: hypothetical protein R3F05_08375 [Planctomycetota bacterium]